MRHAFKLTILVVGFGLGLVFAAGALAQSTGNQEARADSDRAQIDPQQNSANAAKPGDDDHLPFMMKEDSQSGASEPVGIGLIIRTLGALLLVIGILIGSVWALKHLKKSPLGGKNDAPELAVLNTVGIGDRRSLVLVRFGGNTLLLGSTPQSITFLAAEEAAEETTEEAAGEIDVRPSRPRPAPVRSVTDPSDTRGDATGYRTPSFAEELEESEGWGDHGEEY